MKKFFNRIIAIVVLFGVTASFAYAAAPRFVAPIQAPAPHYVALGDSISAYFRVEKGQGYAEILADFLKDGQGYDGLRLTNLSKSGDDSTDIINMINAYSDTIRGADLITISIGANNFLGLVLDRIFRALEQNLGSDFDFDSFEIDENLLGQIAASIGAISLLLEINRNIERFRTDIVTLIETLYELAPTAEIYFMTIYNPVSGTDALFAPVDMLIRLANSVIERNTDLGYTVVDVYAAFREVDAVGLTFVDLPAGSFDPHPSVAGHRLIAGTHFKAITGKALEIPEDYAPVLPLKRSEAVSSMAEGIISLNPMTMFSVFGGFDGGLADFADVPAWHPLSRQIAGARGYGIIFGVGDNLFSPDVYMSRQDYALILSRLFDLLEEMGLAVGLTDGLTAPQPLPADIASVSPYAKGAFELFIGTPLLPTQGGMASPRSPITTAELAALKAFLVP
jgi:lysophospholipase L1-like esterase